MKKIKFALSAVLVLSLLFSASLMAMYKDGDFYLARQTQAAKATRSMLNICNWGYWIFYDGTSAHTPSGDSGGFYPRGTATVIFMDGFVWGGIVDTTGDGEGDHIRVGGQTYNTGTQPGWIETAGTGPNNPPTAVSPDDDRVRIYRIRKDWENLTADDPSVIRDANEIGLDPSEILERYEYSWNNWPTDLGAPYYDNNNNGVYDEGTDEPGIANADQVIWFVVNDLDPSRAKKLYGSPPIGLELQITMWGYNQPTTTLGQIIFKKYKLINKSGVQIDSMFVSQWCDPDVGTYTDDLVGCDTELSLGFGYTSGKTDGLFSQFNLPPAAIGYDFFQGPLVPSAGDTAIFDLQKRPGYKNLPMTSFGYFAAGSDITDPDLNVYDGTLQWYNLLNGMIPNTAIDDPSCFTHGYGPNAGECTKFPVSGDPFRMTGDLDAFGTNLPPGDRRMCLNSGPFTMAVGDTQEVVVAVIGGIVNQPGGDNRNAVEMLKLNDKYAQFLYDKLFKGIPSPPATPSVTARALDQQVILEWGSDQDAVAQTEADDPILGFNFEGYNVYQLPSADASKEQGTLITTYDKKNNIQNIRAARFLASVGDIATIPIQKGSDSGIKRSIVIEKDYLNDRPLYNGSRYYFAVTGYNFNSDPAVPEPSLESSLIPIEVVPQMAVPGTDLTHDPQESISTTHTVGSAGGDVNISVIDPYATTGHDYQVYFNTQDYYRDSDGLWKKWTTSKALGKAADVSDTYVTGSAIYAATPGYVDFTFTMVYGSADGAWIDGIEFEFPAGMTPTSAVITSGSYSNYTSYGQADLPENGTINGNVVSWGDSIRSTLGAIEGNMYFKITFESADVSVPVTVDYSVWDDAYSGTIVDAIGSLTIDEIGYSHEIIRHWNLKDVTAGTDVLEDQTIVNGVNMERVENGKHFAGGEEVGADAAPIADGVQLDVNVLYDAPVDFSTYTSSRSPFVYNPERGYSYYNAGYYTSYPMPFLISSYYYMGWSFGPSAMALHTYDYAPDGNLHGTDNVNLLQNDIELRFTGEYDYDNAITMANGGTYIPIKDGTGSEAVLVGARNYTLDAHPDANNPGDGSVFKVRIPFEVWDSENDQQVAMLIYDREFDVTSADTMYSFNRYGRMYTWFLHEDYATTQGKTATELANSDLLTWNLVHWRTDWETDDVVSFVYDNPIQFGTDTWAFATQAPVTDSEDLAKEAVEKINVFPNPYYAYNEGSTNRFDNYVTFSHLPDKATLRIFNLAGVLVRTLEKDSDAQFLEWDLRNESDLPVASGAYIVHVDMPDLNKEKVLKLFLIQDKQIIKFY